MLGASQLAGAFRLSTSAVLVVDADDGTIVDVNEAFTSAFGHARADVVGKRSPEFGLWTDLHARARVWARLHRDHRLLDEPVEFAARDGRHVHGRMTCEVVETAGRRLILSLIRLETAAECKEVAGSDADGYRALFLAAAEGMYRSLPEGGLVEVNPAMARIFGYDSPVQMLIEVGGQLWQMFADPYDGQCLREEFEVRGYCEGFRARMKRRDGSAVWISLTAHAVSDAAGRLLCYEGSTVDLTESLAAEARLQQSELLYRTLVDNFRDGVFLAQRGRVKFVNPAMAEMLGYRPEELVGTDYMRLIAPEARAEQALRRERREGGSRDFQDYVTAILRKDGTRRLVEVRADAVDYDGDIASIGTARDVTIERERQAALAEAERKYRELFEHSVVGLFRSHPDGRVLVANPALLRMLGYDSLPESAGEFDAASRVYAEPGLREAVLHELADKETIVAHEVELRRRDGTTIWVEMNAHLVRDPTDGIACIEGSVQDITARRAAERLLQQSELRYRNLVEHSQSGVYMLSDDRYTYVNQAFATMLGYDERELLGASFRLLVPTESEDRIDKLYRRRFGGDLPGNDHVLTLVRKDGTRIDVVVSAGAIEIDGKRYASGTIRDVTEQRRFQRDLERHATHDALTGLPNRLLFERELSRRVEQAQSQADHGYAVLFLDLDGFKLVNDSLGHAAGDRLLLDIAARLEKSFAGEGIVARYGGDEFTILPDGPCPAFRAESLARRILGLLAEPFEVLGHLVYSGASLGIVLGHPDYRSPDQILRDADTAMYRAKAGGKANYVVFDEAMHQAARARLALETDLRRALERSEFCVHYQPIVDIGGGNVVGCEALLRWQHPERGLLAPPDFLAAAEESGLIVAIDWWVLEQACRQMQYWKRHYPEFHDLRISVNMDERQFADRGLVESLRDVLERTGLDPHSLALEVTETVFRRGRAGAEETLWMLKELGVLLVVDDFGTGYSSLESFASAPFDVLKIDRSFVADIEANPRHRAIVRTIASLAEELGLMVTAEGVETPAQVQLLLLMGCGTGQGYLYARPVPPEGIEALLRRDLERLRRA